MKTFDSEDRWHALEEAERELTRAEVFHRKRDARKWRKEVRRLKDAGRR